MVCYKVRTILKIIHFCLTIVRVKERPSCLIRTTTQARFKVDTSTPLCLHGLKIDVRHPIEATRDTFFFIREKRETPWRHED